MQHKIIYIYIYIYIYGFAMVNVVGNGHGDMSLNPGRGFLISHNTNTLEKSMNPFSLFPALGK